MLSKLVQSDWDANSKLMMREQLIIELNRRKISFKQEEMNESPKKVEKENPIRKEKFFDFDDADSEEEKENKSSNSQDEVEVLTKKQDSLSSSDGLNRKRNRFAKDKPEKSSFSKSNVFDSLNKLQSSSTGPQQKKRRFQTIFK